MAFTHIKRHNAEQAVEAELLWGQQLRISKLRNLQYIRIPLSLIVSMPFILSACRRMTITTTKKNPQIVHFVPHQRKEDFEKGQKFIFDIEVSKNWPFFEPKIRRILNSFSYCAILEIIKYLVFYQKYWIFIQNKWKNVLLVNWNYFLR